MKINRRVVSTPTATTPVGSRTVAPMMAGYAPSPPIKATKTGTAPSIAGYAPTAAPHATNVYNPNVIESAAPGQAVETKGDYVGPSMQSVLASADNPPATPPDATGGTGGTSGLLNYAGDSSTGDDTSSGMSTGFYASIAAAVIAGLILWKVTRG